MSLANRAASVYGGLATRTRRLRPAAPRQRLVVNSSSGVSLRLTPNYADVWTRPLRNRPSLAERLSAYRRRLASRTLRLRGTDAARYLCDVAARSGSGLARGGPQRRQMREQAAAETSDTHNSAASWPRGIDWRHSVALIAILCPLRDDWGGGGNRTTG